MRLALFEISKSSYYVSLDKVLHVLTGPHIFKLPLLRGCFAGGLIYQGQVVPLLTGGPLDENEDNVNVQPGFVLVCEAEFGLIGVPADKIVRITKIDEIDSEDIAGSASQYETCKIDGCDYHLLDLNRIVEDSDFTLCGLRD